ncbi:MAG: hypothetical protein R3C12_10950 [Planctomycetaceae bacterium]|nr:hypothetical protein [Planctomycetaceae bacterium]
MANFRGFLAYNRVSRGLLLGGICLAGVLTGCGSQVYEDRLKLTRAYYDYVDRLNRNLGPQYTNFGVTLRVPRQFQEVPLPPRKPAAGGEASNVSSAEDLDPRLPEHIPFNLPGLVAVWSTAGGSTSRGGSSEQSYLYLISNYEYWMTYKTSKEKGDPLKIDELLITALSLGLRIPIDPHARGSSTDRINKWYGEQVPDPVDEQFVARKEFTAITLVPPAESELSNREFLLYLYQNGDMRIGLIYDIPRNQGGENLQERIPLSLQTIDLSPDKPRGGGSGAATGRPDPAAPRPGATAF